MCLLQASGVDDGVHGRQMLVDDVLGGFYSPLQGLPVCSRTATVPRQEAVGEHTLDGAAIEGPPVLL